MTLDDMKHQDISILWRRMLSRGMEDKTISKENLQDFLTLKRQFDIINTFQECLREKPHYLRGANYAPQSKSWVKDIPVVRRRDNSLYSDVMENHFRTYAEMTRRAWEDDSAFVDGRLYVPSLGPCIAISLMNIDMADGTLRGEVLPEFSRRKKDIFTFQTVEEALRFAQSINGTIHTLELNEDNISYENLPLLNEVIRPYRYDDMEWPIREYLLKTLYERVVMDKVIESNDEDFISQYGELCRYLNGDQYRDVMPEINNFIETFALYGDTKLLTRPLSLLEARINANVPIPQFNM